MCEGRSVKMRYEAVLFDVDGTLLDTSEGILLSVKDAIRKFGLEMLPDERLLKFIGPPIEWSYEGAYDIHGEELREVCACFRDRYSNHNLLLARPYDGIFDLLSLLKEKGIKIGVATYKKQDYAEKLLKHYGFDKYADVIYGSDYENKLTKADIIDLCIRDLGASDNSKVLMVGDSRHDAEGAARIGTDFAGVSFGFGFGEFGGEDINDYAHVIYADTPLELAVLFEEEE